MNIPRTSTVVYTVTNVVIQYVKAHIKSNMGFKILSSKTHQYLLLKTEGQYFTVCMYRVWDISFAGTRKVTHVSLVLDL